MGDSQELKKIQTRISHLSTERAEVSADTAARLRRIDSEIESLKNQMVKMVKKGKKLIVSEHAMIRYLERVEGLDLELLKTKITGGCDLLGSDVANGLYPILGSHRVKIHNGIVITVIK